MTRKHILSALLFSLIGLAQGAWSRELFEGGKAPPWDRGQLLFGDDQIGGYQIYSGNGNWQFEDASLSMTGGSADSIPLGVVRMTHWDGNEIAAVQTVVANLRANGSHYWSGAPCSGESLVQKSRTRGQFDDCMKIAVQTAPVGSAPVTFLVVETVQTQNAGRYYMGAVGLNVAYLGFPGSTPAEWSKSAVQSDAAKSAALAKLTTWAERYREAALAQMDYQRPADTFAAVPPLHTLKR